MLTIRLSRCCCRAIRRRRPGAYGRTFETTATPDQRWPPQCGSLTARTEKVSTLRPILQASVAYGRLMPTLVQRALPRRPYKGSRVLGPCPPKNPRCSRPYPVSPDGGGAETDRRAVCHRVGDQR